MKSWETIIALVVAAAAGGFALGRMTRKTPLVTAATVAGSCDQAAMKAYVDQRLTEPDDSGSCRDLPQLVSRVAQLEMRISRAEKIKDVSVDIKQKWEKLAEIQKQLRTAREDTIMRERTQEIDKLKAGISKACASVGNDR